MQSEAKERPQLPKVLSFSWLLYIQNFYLEKKFPCLAGHLVIYFTNALCRRDAPAHGTLSSISAGPPLLPQPPSPGSPSAFSPGITRSQDPARRLGPRLPCLCLRSLSPISQPVHFQPKDSELGFLLSLLFCDHPTLQLEVGGERLCSLTARWPPQAKVEIKMPRPS